MSAALRPAVAQFLEALALARLDGGLCAWPPPDLTLDEAYAVAARLHARRLHHGGLAVGRKIGHTDPARWAAQGLRAPSWGWLYADTTLSLPERLDLARWHEPKAELELVFRLGDDRQPEAMALGLEIVDRPYPAWGFGVPASVAAGGVHAALLLGPWKPFGPAQAAALDALHARLQVGEAVSEGGSTQVLGSPLHALRALVQVLEDQEDLPLQPDEIITTGALAPALPLRPGLRLDARLDGLGGSLALPPLRLELV